jgi:hypothetical protein
LISFAARAEPPADTGPTILTIHPATEPVPALKYRLVPERNALIPGNAALFYHRAIQIMLGHREPAPAPGTAPRGKSAEVRIADWSSGPIGEIPLDEARAVLDQYATTLKEVELGAGRASCDWGLDNRKEAIELLIPEIQEMRSLARLVTLRAKLAIRDGKTDEAFHWIQVGLVMGRHVSEGPTIIQYLVGVAIDSIMCGCLEDLIQTPGAPNLFWAFADRPRPFLDLTRSLVGERYLLERELPELNELDTGPWSLDQAQKFADELQRKLFSMTSGEPIPGTNGAIPPDMPSVARRFGIAAMAAKIYPKARRELIAQGRPEAEVDAMPSIQAAALYVIQEYQKVRDDTYKWMNVPYWQVSLKRMDQPMATIGDNKLDNPLLALFQLITPASNSVRLAQVRLERKFDALQCVESIRLYAASHDGKFPPNLDALTDSPVPIDPATGKPFEYALDGETATLSAPLPQGSPEHPAYRVRYVLKMSK